MFSPWLQLKLVYTFKHSPPCITTGPTQIKRFTMDLSNYKRDHWILKLIFYLHYLNPDVWKVLSVCGDIVYQRFATSLEIHSHPWRRTLCQMFVYQFRKLELSFWSVMLYFSIRAQTFHLSYCSDQCIHLGAERVEYLKRVMHFSCYQYAQWDAWQVEILMCYALCFNETNYFYFLFQFMKAMPTELRLLPGQNIRAFYMHWSPYLWQVV